MNAIKATQKLDMLGIGMQHQKDPNGIAWRQNRDFENLLRRLNEGTDAVTGPFHKPREEESLKGGGEETSTSETVNPNMDMDEDERDGDGVGDEDEVVIAKKEKKNKKKKRKTAEALDEEEDPLDKKKRKKRKKVKGDDEQHHALPSDDESEPPLAPCCPPPPPESRKEEPGFAPTTAVTAPVSIRAPYVAPHLTFRGFQIGWLIVTSVPNAPSTSIRPPTAARARTAPASSQPNAWRRQIRLRSPRSSASRPLLPLLPFPPRTPPPPSLLPTLPPPLQSPPLKNKSL
jgi:Pin2-interacting protein X1